MSEHITPTNESNQAKIIFHALPNETNQLDQEFYTPEAVAVASFMNAKRRIAMATGQFYNSVFDTYLGDVMPEDLETQIIHLIEELPGSLQEVYAIGINRFQEELVENHRLLEEHRGSEVGYLLTAVMDSDGINEDQASEVLLNSDKAQFIEPVPGVAIIEAEKDFFRLLKAHGIVHADGVAVNFGSDNRGEPSFLVVQRRQLDNNLADDYSQIKNNRTVRHEFHHFLWNFLQRRGDYLREVNEPSPEQATAFRHFRDEVAAYIIEGRSLGEVEPDVTTYSKDPEILKLAGDIQCFAKLCIDITKQLGTDTQIFLYASMSSRNFEELKDNFAKLTPLDTVDTNALLAIYNATGTNSKTALKVIEFLEKKGIEIPTDLVEELAYNKMSSSDLLTIGSVQSELDRIKRFAEAVKLERIDGQDLFDKVVRARLPIPKETIDTILTLPLEQTQNIVLDKSEEEFLRSLISLWHDNQETVQAYKSVINSSPSMRMAFDSIKDNIIDTQAAIIRQEFKRSSDERKQKAELDIQRRTQLLLGL